jgi:hypothetical protein
MLAFNTYETLKRIGAVICINQMFPQPLIRPAYEKRCYVRFQNRRNPSIIKQLQAVDNFTNLTGSAVKTLVFTTLEAVLIVILDKVFAKVFNLKFTKTETREARIGVFQNIHKIGKH